MMIMTAAVFAALSHLLVAWIALVFCDAGFRSTGLGRTADRGRGA